MNDNMKRLTWDAMTANSCEETYGSYVSRRYAPRVRAKTCINCRYSEWVKGESYKCKFNSTDVKSFESCCHWNVSEKWEDSEWMKYK